MSEKMRWFGVSLFFCSAVLALVACSSTPTSGRDTCGRPVYFEQPKGVPAATTPTPALINPTPANTPTPAPNAQPCPGLFAIVATVTGNVSVQDADAFVQSHRFWRTVGNESTTNVCGIVIPIGTLKEQYLDGEGPNTPSGYPDSLYNILYIEAQGVFQFNGPPDITAQNQDSQFNYAFMVVDPNNGSILLEGGRSFPQLDHTKGGLGCQG
jgi:hypothetical protein